MFLIYFGGLPVHGRVTLRAAGPEAALMLVGVACHAAGRQPHPGMIQILGRQQRTRRRGDMLRVVTGAAGDPDVFTVQHISRLRVIKPFGRRIPVQQGKILAIVIRVAFNAGHALRTRAGIGSMKTMVLL